MTALTAALQLSGSAGSGGDPWERRRCNLQRAKNLTSMDGSFRTLIPDSAVESALGRILAAGEKRWEASCRRA
jgi:hypothetical protein